MFYGIMGRMVTAALRYPQGRPEKPESSRDAEATVVDCEGVVADVCAEAEAVTALLRQAPAGVPAARIVALAAMFLELGSAALGTDQASSERLDRLAEDASSLVPCLQP